MVPVAVASVNTVTTNWDMHDNAPGLPCLLLQFALEGVQKPPNFVDFVISPEQTDRDSSRSLRSPP